MASKNVVTMFPIADISDVEMVFGGNTDKLMPPYEAIPEVFRRGDTHWNRLAQDWFFSGIKDLRLTPRPGVDKAKALRHLRAIQVSFQPKHEHKEAGVAYLLDQWFSDGAWLRAK